MRAAFAAFAGLFALFFAPSRLHAETPAEAAERVLADERFQRAHPKEGDRRGVLDIYGDDAPGAGQGGPGLSGGGDGDDKKPSSGKGRPLEGDGVESPPGPGRGDGATADGTPQRADSGGKSGEHPSGGGETEGTPVPDSTGTPKPRGKDGDEAATGSGPKRVPSDEGEPTGAPNERGAPATGGDDPLKQPPLTAADRERVRRERMRQEREKGLRIPLRAQGKGQVQVDPPSPPSALGQMLSTLLMGLVIAVLVFFLAWGVMSYLRSRRPPEEDAILPKNEGDSDTSGPTVVPSDIERFAAEGRYTEAVHAMFLVTVRQLVARNVLTLTPDTTARETLRSMRAEGAGRSAFTVLVEAVEISIFGGEELDRATFERCFASYRTLGAEPVADTLPRAA
jgi:hypothetical protein